MEHHFSGLVSYMAKGILWMSWRLLISWLWVTWKGDYPGELIQSHQPFKGRGFSQVGGRKGSQRDSTCGKDLTCTAGLKVERATQEGTGEPPGVGSGLGWPPVQKWEPQSYSYKELGLSVTWVSSGADPSPESPDMRQRPMQPAARNPADSPRHQPSRANSW